MKRETCVSEGCSNTFEPRTNKRFCTGCSSINNRKKTRERMAAVKAGTYVSTSGKKKKSTFIPTSEKKLYVCECGKKERNDGMYVCCLDCGKVTLKTKLELA
jgi:hypothetical protein